MVDRCEACVSDGHPVALPDQTFREAANVPAESTTADPDHFENVDSVVRRINHTPFIGRGVRLAWSG